MILVLNLLCLTHCWANASCHPHAWGKVPAAEGELTGQVEVHLRYSVDCLPGALSCKAMMDPWQSFKGILFLSQVMGCPGQHHHKGEAVPGIPLNGQPWPPRHSFCPLEGSSSTGIPLWERDIPHPYLLIQKQKPAQAWRQISCRWGGGRKDGKVSNIHDYLL